MSPANIEAKIKDAHPLIGQACAIGNERPYNVALITLDPELAPVIGKQMLLPEEWLPAGDELTPTMKLKRKSIAEKYAAEIEALYSD